MIDRSEIRNWAASRGWPTAAIAEHDLILQRLCTAIAADDFLGSRLAFSGGTALQKIWMPVGYRFSQDLDYVMVSSQDEDDTDVLARVQGVAVGLGLRIPSRVRRRLKTPFPKAFFDYTSAAGEQVKVKVEYSKAPHFAGEAVYGRSIDDGFGGRSVPILAMSLKYLTATKVSAIYSRSKGRDLYDLCHLIEAGVKASSVSPLMDYWKRNEIRMRRWTAKTAGSVLQTHLSKESYWADINDLDAYWLSSHSIDDITNLIVPYVERVDKGVKALRAIRRG